MIDKDVGFYGRFKRWLEFTIAAGFIGTFVALLVSYDSKGQLLWLFSFFGIYDNLRSLLISDFG